MTLNTHIVIKGNVDAEELYTFMRPLVRTPDAVKPIRKPGKIGNPIGVGAEAILEIYFDKTRFLHGACEIGWCCLRCKDSCEDLGHLATHMDQIQKDRRAPMNEPSKEARSSDVSLAHIVGLLKMMPEDVIQKIRNGTITEEEWGDSAIKTQEDILKRAIQ